MYVGRLELEVQVQTAQVHRLSDWNDVFIDGVSNLAREVEKTGSSVILLLRRYPVCVEVVFARGVLQHLDSVAWDAAVRA